MAGLAQACPRRATERSTALHGRKAEDGHELRTDASYLLLAAVVGPRIDAATAVSLIMFAIGSVRSCLTTPGLQESSVTLQRFRLLAVVLIAVGALSIRK